MNRITSLFLTAIVTVLITSCSKTEEATPVTVVGVWKTAGLGVVTDTKTVDVTLDEIKKVDDKASTALATQVFEFKADGTSIVPGSGSSTNTDAGKYVLSADKKTLTITSNTNKDAKGNLQVQTFEIISLTSTDLKLGVSKLSNKNAAGEFVIDFLTTDLITYLYSAYVFAAKGLNPNTELKAAKTLQATYNLKK
jgi:hypothetical protein